MHDPVTERALATVRRSIAHVLGEPEKPRAMTSGELSLMLLNAFGVDPSKVTSMTLRLSPQTLPSLTVVRHVVDDGQLRERVERLQLQARPDESGPKGEAT